MLKLSSNNKKIVIVADPHNNHTKIDTIFKKEGGDTNICLGDWFDSFTLDDTADYIDTAKYLKDVFLTDPKNYTLFGNHDLHYLFNVPISRCSGYEQWKYEAINKVIGKVRGDIQDKFYWSIVVDDILLTHAGLDRRLLSPICNTNEIIFEYLNECDDEAGTKLKANMSHWFYEAGYVRGGNYNVVGGIVWCDFNQEFQPIEDLRQIVGHTNQWRTNKAVQHHREGIVNIVDANNICIDCNLNQYLTITNGKMELKKYNDL